MPKPGLAIVIGEAKPKGKASYDDEDDSEDTKDVSADYAEAAFDAFKEKDAEAFKAAIKGLVRCAHEDEDEDDDTEVED